MNGDRVNLTALLPNVNKNQNLTASRLTNVNGHASTVLARYYAKLGLGLDSDQVTA